MIRHHFKRPIGLDADRALGISRVALAFRHPHNDLRNARVSPMRRLPRGASTKGHTVEESEQSQNGCSEDESNDSSDDTANRWGDGVTLLGLHVRHLVHEFVCYRSLSEHVAAPSEGGVACIAPGKRVGDSVWLRNRKNKSPVSNRTM